MRSTGGLPVLIIALFWSEFMVGSALPEPVSAQPVSDLECDTLEIALPVHTQLIRSVNRTRPKIKTGKQVVGKGKPARKVSGNKATSHSAKPQSRIAVSGKPDQVVKRRPTISPPPLRIPGAATTVKMCRLKPPGEPIDPLLLPVVVPPTKVRPVEPEARQKLSPADRPAVGGDFNVIIERPKPKPPQLSFAPPDRLGFLQYNVTATAAPTGNQLFSTNGAGLRLGLHAFDLRGNIATDGRQVSGFLNEATYRRDWFDRKLFLTVGRTVTETRGLVAGGRLTGVVIARRNIDDLGQTIVAERPAFQSVINTPGVISYRIGNTVLRQAPIGAGEAELPPDFLNGLPPGGIIEVTTIDGQSMTRSVQDYQSTGFLLFAPGRYELVSGGGIMVTPGGREEPGVMVAGRYGATYDLTFGGTMVGSGDNVTLGGDVAWRLPKSFGAIGMTAAVQSFYGSSSALGSLRTSVRTNYEWRNRRSGFGLFFDLNRAGGVLSPVLRTSALGPTFPVQGLGSIFPTERLRARFNTRLPGSSVQMSIDVNRQWFNARSTQTQIGTNIGGSFFRQINWSVFGQYSPDALSTRKWGIGINLSAAIGSRASGTLAYQNFGTQQLSGNLNGSATFDYASDFRYSAQVDASGRLDASVGKDWRVASTDIRVGYANGAISAAAGARGSVVFGDEHVTATRDIGDTYVLLSAKDVSRASVFLQSGAQRYSRLDDNGYVAIATLSPYRPNRIGIEAVGEEWNIKLPSNVFTDAVQPHSGYIRKVDAKVVRPVRLVIELPEGARLSRAFAIFTEGAIPVEEDRTVYVENRESLENSFSIAWTDGDQSKECIVDLTAYRDQVQRAQFSGLVDVGECIPRSDQK